MQDMSSDMTFSGQRKMQNHFGAALPSSTQRFGPYYVPEKTLRKARSPRNGIYFDSFCAEGDNGTHFGQMSRGDVGGRSPSPFHAMATAEDFFNEDDSVDSVECGDSATTDYDFDCYSYPMLQQHKEFLFSHSQCGKEMEQLRDILQYAFEFCKKVLPKCKNSSMCYRTHGALQEDLQRLALAIPGKMDEITSICEQNFADESIQLGTEVITRPYIPINTSLEQKREEKVKWNTRLNPPQYAKDEVKSTLQYNTDSGKCEIVGYYITIKLKITMWEKAKKECVGFKLGFVGKPNTNSNKTVEKLVKDGIVKPANRPNTYAWPADIRNGPKTGYYGILAPEWANCKKPVGSKLSNPVYLRSKCKKTMNTVVGNDEVEWEFSEGCYTGTVEIYVRVNSELKCSSGNFTFTPITKTGQACGKRCMTQEILITTKKSKKPRPKKNSGTLTKKKVKKSKARSLW